MSVQDFRQNKAFIPFVSIIRLLNFKRILEQTQGVRQFVGGLTVKKVRCTIYKKVYFLHKLQPVQKMIVEWFRKQLSVNISSMIRWWQAPRQALKKIFHIYWAHTNKRALFFLKFKDGLKILPLIVDKTISGSILFK